jgi:hypothetical protein
MTAPCPTCNDTGATLREVPGLLAFDVVSCSDCPKGREHQVELQARAALEAAR